jgi:hypothetical protein
VGGSGRVAVISLMGDTVLAGFSKKRVRAPVPLAPPDPTGLRTRHSRVDTSIPKPGASLSLPGSHSGTMEMSCVGLRRFHANVRDAGHSQQSTFPDIGSHGTVLSFGPRRPRHRKRPRQTVGMCTARPPRTAIIACTLLRRVGTDVNGSRSESRAASMKRTQTRDVRRPSSRTCSVRTVLEPWS